MRVAAVIEMFLKTNSFVSLVDLFKFLNHKPASYVWEDSSNSLTGPSKGLYLHKTAKTQKKKCASTYINVSSRVRTHYPDRTEETHTYTPSITAFCFETKYLCANTSDMFRLLQAIIRLSSINEIKCKRMCLCIISVTGYEISIFY